MAEFLTILVSAALVNNLVLVQLLGVSSFFAASSQLAKAGTLGLLTSAVLITSSLLNFAFNKFLLTPLSLEFLRLLVFVVISTLLTTLFLLGLKKNYPHSFRRHQLAMFMVGGNSAVVGVSLLTVKSSLSLLETLAYSVGSACGFVLVLLMFAALRERLESADSPLPFKGLALDMISAGVVAMAFLGFAGIV